MLKKIKITNLAIIDNIELDLDNGFNVFTGQTGAGKSLIIDSVSLLLGNRSDSYMIREGFDYAYIFGLFSYSNDLDKIFLDLGLQKTEDIKIERYIYKNKSTIKINDKNITLNKLNLISSKLGDICSQTDTYKLFNKENYLSFITANNDKVYSNLLNDYLNKREMYLNKMKDLNQLIKQKEEREQDLTYATIVYNELLNYDLKEGELNEVEDKINKLKNFDKIYETLVLILESLNGEKFDIDILSKLSKNVEKISEFDKDLITTSNALDEAYIILSETLSDIKVKISSLSFDPSELEILNKRENDIKNLMLKYHKTYEELVEYQKELKEITQNNLDYDSLIKEEEESLRIGFNETLQAAFDLSKHRKEEAKKFEKEIINLAIKLDLKDINFKVKFEDIDTKDFKNSQIFLETGIDIIDFLVGFNKERNLLPLALVASGGEMSRLMLGFKLYSLRNKNNYLLVLDEIDTGVSGLQSKKIGLLIKEYSKNNQILLITHNPIIASQAESHYLIKKIENKDRMVSRVSKLNNDEREKEIALMLEGEVSETSICEAKKLIKNASNL